MVPSSSLVGLVLGVALTIGFYLFYEFRRRSPVARWPAVAGDLGFAFRSDPPRLEGRWKEVPISIGLLGAGASVTSPLKAPPGLRVEAGPKEVLELAAGLVVPDRVDIPDPKLAARLLVRAQPRAAGEAVDVSVLRRLLEFPGARLLAVPGRVELLLTAVPLSAAEVRSAADIVVAVADSLSGG